MMQSELPLQEQRSSPSAAVYHAASKLEFGDVLPDIPTMLGTRLQLELLFQDTWIDLAAVARVILADPGATLQVLRLVGEEYQTEEGRPSRMEDCLASLTMKRCFEVICASSIPQNSGILAQWEHFRRVAESARQLAQCGEGFSPEEAYLVGLLSELGQFPRLLGWNASDDSGIDQPAVGVMLADYWRLPDCLTEAIRERHDSSANQHWSEFLGMARCIAAGSEALSDE